MWEATWTIPKQLLETVQELLGTVLETVLETVIISIETVETDEEDQISTPFEYTIHGFYRNNNSFQDGFQDGF